MARYFFHLRDGTDELLDPFGGEFADLDSMREAVLANARDCLCGDMRRGLVDLRFRIDAEDEGGVLIYSLPFANAFSLIPAGPVAPASAIKGAPAEG